MGCGREIAVRGRPWGNWFRCAACGRVHVLRERLVRFRYDEAYRRSEARKRAVFVAIAFLMSTLGGWIIAREVGRPALIYGIEWASAALICGALYRLSRLTQDVFLVMGVLSALFAARRIALLDLVAYFGAPPYARFPVAMLAAAAVCFAVVAYQRRFIEAL